MVAAAASSTAKGASTSTSFPTRELGRTGVRVSIVGLGGFHLGIPPEPEAIRMVRTAVDGGLTFLDNCWDYNEGRSEERMGKALRDGYRQRAFLMTKIDGRTAKAAAAQIEQSLKRLQTDAIDLVQIHEVIRPSDPKRCFDDGCVQALIDAQKAGKLRFIGFTGHKDPKIHLAMLEEADRRGFRFDTVQMPLNVMDAHFRSFEREVLPVLQQKGIGVLGMKPMGAGEILKAKVVTANECLRYSLSLPTSVVITGCDSIERVEQALSIGRSFTPLAAAEKSGLLAKTAKAAAGGEHEPFKTSQQFDGTAQNPHWLEEARL